MRTKQHSDGDVVGNVTDDSANQRCNNVLEIEHLINTLFVPFVDSHVYITIISI